MWKLQDAVNLCDFQCKKRFWVYFGRCSQYLIIYWSLFLKVMQIKQNNLCSADFEMLF